MPRNAFSTQRSGTRSRGSGVTPRAASSSRVTASSNLTLPLTFYQGRGLCPSCGGKSATSGAVNYSGSMKLQVADGAVTTGTASINVIGPNNISITKPLGPIELVTKP